MRHSPLRRAAQTAEILAGYLPGVPVGSSGLLSDRTPVPSAGQASAVPPLYRPFVTHNFVTGGWRELYPGT